MSSPRKHHFIPQVHIEKFRTDNKFKVFDISAKKTFIKNNCNDLFEVKDSNVIIDENGNKDFTSEERYFSDVYESKYNHYYNVLLSFINSEDDGHSLLNKETMDYFLEYAISTRFRAQRVQKKEIEEYISRDLLVHERMKSIYKERWFSIMRLLFKKRSIELIQSSERRILVNSQLKVPIPNVKDVKSFMIDDYYIEILICKNGGFILPDCGSIIYRKKDTRRTDVNHIAQVILPVSKNIVLRYTHTGLCPLNGWLMKELNKFEVEMINEILKESVFKYYIGV